MSIAEPDFASQVQLAWRGELDFFKLLDYSSQLEGKGLHALAAVLYQTWLKRNQTTHNHFVYFNLGVALSNEGDMAGAEEAYRQAIQLSPSFAQPRINLGLSCERRGNLEAALAEWSQVEQYAGPDKPDQQSVRLQALNHMGRALEGARRYAEAIAHLTTSLTIDPNQPDVIHHWVFLRARVCDWPIYDNEGLVSPEMLRRHTSALGMVSLSDDPAAQLEAARNYVQNKLAQNVASLAPDHSYQHQKIRIGYCSSDFCLHPVAMLTAELFELHNRESFEIFGFCWSPEDGSALRQRVIKAMDHFIRIDKLDDETAARLIRELEIDILVDLHGQTLGARANMLAYRPAPIQITYLGLPATTGLPSIDYVIADRFLIPEDQAEFYSEKPLYMPDVYQVSDRKRLNSPPPSRQGCGLPSEGFVFCSFNNNYKFTPEVFDAWMNILQRVPESVLWLLSDNPRAEANLRKEAETRGVDAHRIVFAERTSPENYLAHYEVADLFLDTFPFNGGTTANDALWMGLPVLTCSGRSFASRMAGALLTAAGLEELITYDLNDYQDKAVALAMSPEQCSRFAEHLKQVREHGTLFDTPRFVRNLEARLQELVAAL
jgi:predicted O-linked N-acetylglucosamine transferase (SPINDLY family)